MNLSNGVIGGNPSPLQINLFKNPLNAQTTNSNDQSIRTIMNQNNQNIQNQAMNNINMGNRNNVIYPTKGSLFQQHSFKQLKELINDRNKSLSQNQMNFIKIDGSRYFFQDEEKSKDFNQKIIKTLSLGLQKDINVFGFIPPNKQIDQFWIQLIKTFSLITQTNQLNGYYLLKKMLKQSKVFQEFYSIQQDFNMGAHLNKTQLTYFIRMENLNKNFVTDMNQMRIVNKNSPFFQSNLKLMIRKYVDQYFSYLQIIQHIAMNYNDRRKHDNQKQKKLKFKDLDQYNVIYQLWNIYKQFAFSNYVNLNFNIFDHKSLNQLKQQFHKSKIALFYKVSNLIRKIIKNNYSQINLLKKNPLPIFQAIQFINRDIQICISHHIIKPDQIQNYQQQCLQILMNSIPFSAFIKNEPIIQNYFNLQQSKNNYIYLQHRTKRKLLDQLNKLENNVFFPLKLFAQQQIQKITYQQNYFLSKNLPKNISMPLKQQQIKQIQKFITLQRQKNINHFFIKWQNSINKKTWNLNSHYSHSWFAWFLSNLSSCYHQVINSNVARNFISLLCKKKVKTRAQLFTNLWNKIYDFHKNKNQLNQSHNQNNSLLQRLNENDSSQLSQSKLAQYIINTMDLYFMGRFMIILFQNSQQQEPLQILTKIIEQLPENSDFINNFMKQIEKSNQDIHPFVLITAMISQYFQIPVKQMFKLQKEGDNQSKILKRKNTWNNNCLRQVKFLCTLVKKNMNNLLKIQQQLFQLNQDELNISRQFQGLRICSFLFLIFKKNIHYNQNSVKCMRYLISTLNMFFSNQKTRNYFLLMISILFPYKNDNISNYYEQDQFCYRQQQQSIKSKQDGQNINMLMKIIKQNYNTSKYFKKLKEVCSFHFNNILKLTDSIDEYFPIQTRYSSNQYMTLQKDLNQFNLNSIFLFIQNQQIMRPSQWFYEFVRLLSNKQTLQAIQIQNIILSIKKMRIKFNSTPSFYPMQVLSNIINIGYLDMKIINILTPTIQKKNNATMIINDQLQNCKNIQIQFHVSLSQFNKYQDQSYVKYKRQKISQNNKKYILRKIYMALKLVQLVFLIKYENNSDYIIINQLKFIDLLYNALTGRQNIKKYYCKFIVDNETHNTEVNILYTIINYLYLTMDYPILVNLQNNYFYQQKYYQSNKLTLSITSDKILQIYKQQLQDIDIQFANNIFYDSNNFSQSKDNSLFGIIINIVKLIVQNGKGSILCECLSSCLNPQRQSRNSLSYHFTQIGYQKNNDSRLNTLFKHFKKFCGSKQIGSLDFQSKIFQTLSIMLQNQQLQMIILNDIKIYFSRVSKILGQLNSNQNNKSNSAVDQINIFNKTGLFVYRAIQSGKKIYTDKEFKQRIVRPFFTCYNNQYTNILRQLIILQFKLSKYLIGIDQLLFCKSDQILLNYIIQKSLYKNSVYRASINLILRILQSILQYLTDSSTILYFDYLIKSKDVILKRTISIQQEQQFINKYRLIPYDYLTLQNKQQNLKLLQLSPNVLNFKYSQLSNFHKYGPNFIYDTHEAFHLLKTKKHLNCISRYQEQQSLDLQQQKLQIRKQIYFLQIINSVKSLNFACQALTFNYFSIFNVMINIGPFGNNLSNPLIQLQLPASYLNTFLSNRYKIKSQFSLQKCFLNQNFQYYWQTNPPLSIENFLDFCYHLVIFVNNIENSQNPYLQYIIKKDYQTQLQQMVESVIIIEGQPVNCINSQILLILFHKICILFPKILITQKDSKTQEINSILKIYQKILDIILDKKIFFTLNLTLYTFYLIIQNWQKIIKIQTKFHQKHQNIQKHLIGRNRIFWQKIHKILQFIFELLHQKFDRHLLYQNLQSQITHQDDFLYSKQNILNNCHLITTICKRILDSLRFKQFNLQNNHLFIEDSYLQTNYYNCFYKVNYVIRVILNNYYDIQSSFHRSNLMLLCNQYYINRQDKQIIHPSKWKFHDIHIQISKNSIFHQQLNGQDQFFLQKITSYDTFIILSKLYPIQFNKQIVKIIMNLIQIKQTYKQEKQYLNKFLQIQTRSTLSTLQYNQKLYDLRNIMIWRFTNNQLFALNKIFTLIFSSFHQQSWKDKQIYSHLQNIFIQILNFKSLEFNFSRVHPTKKIQQQFNQIYINSDFFQRNTTTNFILTTEINKYSGFSNGLSLFQFMMYLNHSQIILNYIRILKSGFYFSNLMKDYQAIFLKKQFIRQIWDNLFLNLSYIHEYLVNMLKIFYQNKNMTLKLIQLYNYTIQEASYLNYSKGVYLIYDIITKQHVNQTLLKIIYEYSQLILLICPISAKNQWKTSKYYKQQRIQILNQCMSLIKKKSTQQLFRNYNLHDQYWLPLLKNIQNQFEKFKYQQYNQ